MNYDDDRGDCVLGWGMMSDGRGDLGMTEKYEYPRLYFVIGTIYDLIIVSAAGLSRGREYVHFVL